MLSPKAHLQVVGVADDGKSAIALVETLNFDVILIDIEMPKMTEYSRINKNRPDLETL